MFICNEDNIDLSKYPYHIHDVHISDPFILADPISGHYFTYVQFINPEHFPDITIQKGVFYYLESEDLIHWTKPVICFHEENFWANMDFWAPEVHIWNGKYYLISSFRAEGTYRRCQALVSDSPRGPFSSLGMNPLTPEGWQCLDGTLYIDLNNEPWLVFCHEWLQVNDGQICAIKLSDDLSRSIGEPTILFRASDGPWTGKTEEGGTVTDGPFLYRLSNGQLLMLWSSYAKGGGYAISYCRSLSGEIIGPWEQQIEPLYNLDGGHAMLFHTFSGQLMMSCHCPNDHPKKRILLFEMEEREKTVHIINEVTGNWYQNAGGLAKNWTYKSPCIEKPVFMQDPKANDKKSGT